MPFEQIKKTFVQLRNSISESSPKITVVPDRSPVSPETRQVSKVWKDMYTRMYTEIYSHRSPEARSQPRLYGQELSTFLGNAGVPYSVFAHHGHYVLCIGFDEPQVTLKGQNSDNTNRPAVVIDFFQTNTSDEKVRLGRNTLSLKPEGYVRKLTMDPTTSMTFPGGIDMFNKRSAFHGYFKHPGFTLNDTEMDVIYRRLLREHGSVASHWPTGLGKAQREYNLILHGTTQMLQDTFPNLDSCPPQVDAESCGYQAAIAGLILTVNNPFFIPQIRRKAVQTLHLLTTPEERSVLERAGVLLKERKVKVTFRPDNTRT